MIERKIIIGLIASTEYFKKIRPVWDSMLLQSSTARMVANWCVEYFDKYNKAPNKEIETIFFNKIEEGLDKEIAEEIEEDILPDLSDELVEDGLDLDYLIDSTFSYLKIRQYKRFQEQIKNILENGEGDQEDRLKQVEILKDEFKPINYEDDDSLDLSDRSVFKAIEKAFISISQSIIYYPKQLGKFINNQLVAGAFVVFFGIEKRGKTFWLLDLAMRAARQKRNVAFFQAGDMNEAEQLKRIGVYLLKRSNLKEYCTEHYQVVRDCKNNQTDECNKPERECNFSPFDDKDMNNIGKLNMDELIAAYEMNEDYQPCYNCENYNIHKTGTPWIKKIPKCEPISYRDVQKAVKKFFTKHKRRFKLSTHPTGTLTFKKVDIILDKWEGEGFVPEVILFDYLAIMDAGIRGDTREKENKKWMDARKLSQTKRGGIFPLVISVDQVDALAYNVHRLSMNNFSEDKRKWGHVTAAYGLNQDPDGIEKSLGIIRLNKLVLREGAFVKEDEVYVLQDLRQGRPFIGSFF